MDRLENVRIKEPREAARAGTDSSTWSELFHRASVAKTWLVGTASVFFYFLVR